MREKHNNNMIRRIVDVCMTVSLLFLMAYQVTGEVLHEWTGIAMTAKMKIEGKTRTAINALFCCLAGTGLFLFLRNGWFDYMFFRAAFAFLDYEKAGALVFLENLIMLLPWAFIGDQAAVLCRLRGRKAQTAAEEHDG